MTFFEAINIMPPTNQWKNTFCAVVIRGTCDKVPLTLTTTGEHVQFYTGLLNIFNVGKIGKVCPTQVSLFTCGNPTNTASYIYRGTSSPGTQMISEYLGEPTVGTLVTDQKKADNVSIDLATDLNNDGAVDRSSDPAAQLDIEKKEGNPGKFIGLNNYDANRDAILDKDQIGPIDYIFDMGRQPLKLADLSVSIPIGMTATVRLERTSNIRVWCAKEKGKDKMVLVTDKKGNELLMKEWKLPDEQKDLDKIKGTLYVEGYIPGIGALTATLVDAKGKEIAHDSIAYTVVKCDLDTDSNNDGMIDADDKGEDGYEEFQPGRIVSVETDGKEDEGIVNVCLLPEGLKVGTVTISVLSSATVLWGVENGVLDSPKIFTLSRQSIPKSLWLNGIERGKVLVTMEYRDPSGAFVHIDTVRLTVVAISWSPTGRIIYTWEPNNWPGNPDGRVETEPVDISLANIKDQGYLGAVRFIDETYQDNDTGKCTPENFLKIKDSAIFISHTHGGPGFSQVIFTADEATAERWADAIGDRAFTRVDRSGYMPFVVDVKSAWFKKHWKPERDARNAITLVLSCNSATGADSVVAAMGGRVGFGYDDVSNCSQQSSDVKILFVRMSGRIDSGKFRPAWDAYGTGSGYTKSFKSFGNLWTTLAPAPVGMFPEGIALVGKRWGCFIYDTYMDGETMPVTKEAGKADVTNYRWVRNPIENFCVGFDIYLRKGEGAKMKVTPSLSKATKAPTKDEPVMGHMLDGDGVAPNGDGKQWEFKAK